MRIPDDTLDRRQGRGKRGDGEKMPPTYMRQIRTERTDAHTGKENRGNEANWDGNPSISAIDTSKLMRRKPRIAETGKIDPAKIRHWMPSDMDQLRQRIEGGRCRVVSSGKWNELYRILHVLPVRNQGN